MSIRSEIPELEKRAQAEVNQAIGGGGFRVYIAGREHETFGTTKEVAAFLLGRISVLQPEPL